MKTIEEIIDALKELPESDKTYFAVFGKDNDRMCLYSNGMSNDIAELLTNAALQGDDLFIVLKTAVAKAEAILIMNNSSHPNYIN